MEIRPQDITIAVTVYRRLDYLERALRSAVEQTIPVAVRLFDDGCTDQNRLQALLTVVGGKVEYHRNEPTLGLFRNMNRCLLTCRTRWISILHDDDALTPDFVEKILEVAPQVDRAGLFCGGSIYMDTSGRSFHRSGLSKSVPWRKVEAAEYAVRNQFPFPGQLIDAELAREVGGFPEKSIYTGDWELWFKLTQRAGAVQLSADLGLHRVHFGSDRGTTAAAKSGRKSALVAVQVKRNLARLRKAGQPGQFDRRAWLKAYGPLYQDLLVYAGQMPSWLLSYNRRLLLLASPPGRFAAVVRTVSRWGGNPGIRLCARLARLATRLGVALPPTY